MLRVELRYRFGVAQLIGREQMIHYTNEPFSDERVPYEVVSDKLN